MQLGIILMAAANDTRSSSDTKNDLVSRAVQAEELDFDTICIMEHKTLNNGAIPDALRLVQEIAERTAKIKILTTAIQLSSKDPAQVFEDYQKLREDFGDRIMLGVCKGFEAGPTDNWQENCRRLKALFNKKRQAFAAPAQDFHVTLARDADTLDYARQNNLGVLSASIGDRLKNQLERTQAAPSPIPLSINRVIGFAAKGSTEEDLLIDHATKIMKRPYDPEDRFGLYVVGDKYIIKNKLLDLQEAGIALVMCNFIAAAHNEKQIRKQMQRFSSEVMPILGR